MEIKSVTLGYWYPRTTLHLSELYDFFRGTKSPLPLNPSVLEDKRAELQITDLRLELAELEFIEGTVRNGLVFRIYEDGLVTLTKIYEETTSDLKILKTYFEQAFSPAIAYLFSLGAPVPKELANIKTTYPYFITTQKAKAGEATELIKQLGEQASPQITDKKIQVWRGDTFYVINSDGTAPVFDLVEMLIYVREFKAQMHHYLNLHRTLWEKIASIKEKKFVRGRDVEPMRHELESYKKTIELIEGRIKQMPLYAATREEIIAREGWEKLLTETLQFKYKNLTHTLEYVRSIWEMTKQYIDATISQFNELNSASTRSSIQALTVITSLGLVSSLISFLGTKAFPSFTTIGIFYLLILIVLTWLINRIISYIFQIVRYRLSDVTSTKNLTKL